jgi:prefoldin alpha subunit
MLANLGKGIFIPAEIKEKELLVNVGKSILIKKNPEETLKIIGEQIKKLIDGKNGFVLKIENLQEEMQQLLLEMQKEQKKEN